MYPHQIKAVATKYAFEANIKDQRSRQETHLQSNPTQIFATKDGF